jgi:hypothetical protein
MGHAMPCHAEGNGWSAWAMVSLLPMAERRGFYPMYGVDAHEYCFWLKLWMTDSNEQQQHQFICPDLLFYFFFTGHRFLHKSM